MQQTPDPPTQRAPDPSNQQRLACASRERHVLLRHVVTIDGRRPAEFGVGCFVASSVMRTIALRVLCVSALFVAAGCSEDNATPSATSTLTIDQATRLSRVLVDNYDRSGATFEARLDDGSLALSGDIDWQGHFGHAQVTASGSEQGVTEVYWSLDVVLERRPALEGQIVGSMTVPAWIARSPDPAQRQLDNMLSVITALAGTSADNPLLVQQTAGTFFVEAGDVRGVAAEALTYSDTTIYWLAVDDGRLLRLHGGQATARLFTIDILQFGPRSITGPPTNEVIDVALIQDEYDASR